MRSDARLWSYLDRAATQHLIGEHLDGKANHRLLIWSLLNLETWLELFTSAKGLANVQLAQAATTPRRRLA
jgi:asparagine synthase (glutamine-hydrolysing)